MSATSEGSPQLASQVKAASSTAAGISFQPLLSAGGTRLVFLSQAGNLVSEPADPAVLNVYAKDLDADMIELVSINAQGSAGGAESSGHPSISSNGQWVCFFSLAPDLVADDTNHVGDIFVRDLIGGTTTLVSVNWSGNSSGQGYSSQPFMTDNGRWVVFASDASDLVAGDTNKIADVFLRDLQQNLTHLISVGGMASASNANPYLNGLSVSQDGTRIAFGSRGSNYHAQANSPTLGEIYVRDRTLHETRWVSASARDYFPESSAEMVRSFDSVISPDGEWVVYKTGTND